LAQAIDACASADGRDRCLLGREIAKITFRARLLTGVAMTEKTIDLDEHRGMAAQKATRLRRLVAEVRADRDALRDRQDALEAQLVAAPAESWEDAAEKARYLLTLFASSLDAQDPRRQKLIAAVLDDFTRLAESSEAPKADR
jgi:hypothetical protein